MSLSGSIDVDSMQLAGNAVQVIESCNSTWIFDAERGRFRRAPRGSAIDVPAPDHEWDDYFGLELLPDSGAFVVRLNEAGTRLLRAYRHGEGCSACGDEATGELSVAGATEPITPAPG